MAIIERRRRLPNRRPSETLEFEHGGLRFTLSFSRFHDGGPATPLGAALDTISKDGAS